jgi:hypothetical protein
MDPFRTEWGRDVPGQKGEAGAQRADFVSRH